MNLDFLEIGTSDFDTLLQSESAVSGMSVEPIKLYFDRLPDKANNIKVNCAISDYDGEIDVFYIEPIKIKEFDLPWWVRGCNSVKKYHPTVYSLLKDRKLNPEKIITKHTVPVKRMVTLIKEFDIQSLSYLKIDTEGHDCVILNDYIDSYIEDGNVVLPKEILFESNVLSDDLSVEKIKKRLQKIGYREMRSGHDTLMSREVEACLPWQNVDLPMTAVILNWKRLDNLRIIVRQLRKREFITEVLIWNNSLNNVEFSDLGLDEHYDWLTIINSSENLKDKAKYLAASRAKNDYIFYQDDDWSTAHYIDGMYAVYCMKPDSLHTATGELTWAENQFFSFYNKDLKIQSEFCFIGCGSMFPKSYALQHIRHIESFLSASEQSYADVAFSLLLNQSIVMLQVGLRSFSQENAFSSESDFQGKIENIKRKTVKQLCHLEHHENSLTRCVPRSVFGNLVLFTSYLPNELDQSNRIFDPKNKKHVEDRIKLKPSGGVSSVFRKNPYFNAIVEMSNNEAVFWHTEVNIGDEWGVWLLKPRQIKLNIINMDNSSNESLWDVKVDGVTVLLTLEHLMNFDRQVKTELRIVCVNTLSKLAIHINAK